MAVNIALPATLTIMIFPLRPEQALVLLQLRADAVDQHCKTILLNICEVVFVLFYTECLTVELQQT